MGTLVGIEKSKVRAMMLEILLKDKELFKDIFKTVIAEDPNCLGELTFTNASIFVKEPLAAPKEKETNVAIENVSDEELNFWVDQHFKEYDDVFKALA
jgi:hypothetical protein